MSAKTPAKGHTAKHVHRKKHAGAKPKHKPAKQHKPVPAGSGHNVHTVAHHPKPAKPRGLALDGLPVCAAEAVAMSLRLAGQPVSDDEVAWLWELAGAREMPIAEALAAASRFGLAGCRPVFPGRHETTEATEVAAVGHAAVDEPLGEKVIDDLDGDLIVLPRGIRFGEHLFRRNATQLEALLDFVADRSSVHALILGVDVPGPHCVLATPDGWWSWGKLHDPWPCRIEEAWTVTWHGH